jgi:N-carbamoylputrescine amidase
VAAANRIGIEKVFPCEGNANQSSELTFYGSSFITDNTGEIAASASRDKEEIIKAEFDFDALVKDRLSWGLFRDRRPEMYHDITV